MDDLLQRTVPHDTAAERGVLGAILREPDVLPIIRAILTSAAFYHDHHQRLFEAICGMDEARTAIDLVTVHATIRQGKLLDDIGGVPYLTELWEAVPTAANAEYHAKIVQDAALVRGLIHTANEILRDAYDRCEPAPDMIASAQAKFADLGIRSVGLRNNVRHVGEVMLEVLKNTDERIAAGRELTGLPTGYPGIDGMLGGLRPGQFVVIGARPSVGKTAYGVNIAAHVAETGKPVLFFSLEMPATEIAGRLLSMDSNVPMHRFSRGTALDQDDAGRLITATHDGIGKVPMYVDDTPGVKVQQINAVVRLAMRRHKISLVVVDYLQLIQSSDGRRNDNRATEVSAITNRLKILAREWDVPVVCMCQLNREVENRPDQRPRLSDLRESGSIEQDADIVMLLHRPPGQLDTAECWTVECNIAKQRNGPTGTIPLNYRRGVMRFESSIPSW